MLPTIEQLVTIAKGWPQMKLSTTKVVSSLECIFLMTQRSCKFKYRAFLATKYVPSEVYQAKSYMEPSPSSVRGCMWQISLWSGILTLRYGVKSLGVSWHMDFEGEIWCETDPTSTLTGCSKTFSDTRSSPVEASRHPNFISNKSFNWPVLLNLASIKD